MDTSYKTDVCIMDIATYRFKECSGYNIKAEDKRFLSYSVSLPILDNIDITLLLVDLHDKIDSITGDGKAIFLNKKVVGEFKEKDEKD